VGADDEEAEEQEGVEEAAEEEDEEDEEEVGAAVVAAGEAAAADGLGLVLKIALYLRQRGIYNKNGVVVVVVVCVCRVFVCCVACFVCIVKGERTNQDCNQGFIGDIVDFVPEVCSIDSMLLQLAQRGANRSLARRLLFAIHRSGRIATGRRDAPHESHGSAIQAAEKHRLGGAFELRTVLVEGVVGEMHVHFADVGGGGLLVGLCGEACQAVMEHEGRVWVQAGDAHVNAEILN